jgi:hypothetical protein
MTWEADRAAVSGELVSDEDQAQEALYGAATRSGTVSVIVTRTFRLRRAIDWVEGDWCDWQWIEFLKFSVRVDRPVENVHISVTL